MAPKHGFWDRLTGHHEWVETSRWWNGLWSDAEYRCLVCGVRRTQNEHPEEGERSLDPRVKAEQIAKDEAEAAKLREAR